jgi:hypothetical protein
MKERGEYRLNWKGRVVKKTYYTDEKKVRNILRKGERVCRRERYNLKRE